MTEPTGTGNDPWKAINNLFGGKMPLLNLPDNMNNGEWVRAMVDDIMKRAMDSVSGNLGSPASERPQEPKTAAQTRPHARASQDRSQPQPFTSSTTRKNPRITES